MPISSFVDYLTLEKKYSKHTILAYTKDVEDFSLFIKADFNLDNNLEVNYSIIRSWIVMLVDNGISNKSINRKISSLNSYYKFLLKTKQITENPLVKHKALKTSKKIQVPFSEEEVAQTIALFENAKGFEAIRNKLIVELFYATGMRRTELINLTLSDVSISSGTIKVLGKRNKERIIPLLSSIKQTLKQYIADRDSVAHKTQENLLLTKKGTPVYETLIYRVIHSYFSKTSVKVKRSPHIIRHSFATHLLNQGADINAVKELLGHSSLASTQIYTHNNIEQLKDVYKGAHPRS